MNRLVTIPISHYCEKARWALERAGIPYKEERHLQGFHAIYTAKAGGSDTAPVLVTGDGVFDDSTKILQWVDSRLPEGSKLYPAANKKEICELEESFDEGLGVAGRLWMYTFMLKHFSVMLKYSKIHGVPKFESFLMPVLYPLLRSRISQILEMTPTSRNDTHNAIDKIFNDVGMILGDGRRFLTGKHFTAADLTFAALATPVVLPENYGVALPTLAELPSEMVDQIRFWRSHPAGEFALRLFREERRF